MILAIYDAKIQKNGWKLMEIVVYSRRKIS